MSARGMGALAGALVFDVLPRWPAHKPPEIPSHVAYMEQAISRDRALKAAEAKRSRKNAARAAISAARHAGERGE